MQLRCYRTKIDFVHSIEYREELVDKACVEDHVHPNAELIFEIQTAEWVDFKVLKECCNLAIAGLTGPLPHLEKDGIQFYNIGKIDTETFVKDLRKLVKAELRIKNLHKILVDIQLWETPKYGLHDIDTEEVL